MPIDPDLIDEEGLQQSMDDTLNFIEQVEEKREADAAIEQQTQTQETQEKAEQDDPRNKEDWGFKGLLKEGQSILTGGVQDTLSSTATFAERTFDAFSGEMQKEQKEKDTITPTTVEDMQEVERLYKNYTRKHGLIAT